MVRLTPRITPYVPKPGHLSPGHFARSVPRAVLTGNVPHPRVGGAVPKLNTAPAKAVKPALVTLTTASSTGRARSANPKPKTPTQLAGYSTRPKQVRPPSSMAAQRPGVHSLKGAKMKINRANPMKVPKIH